MQSYRDQVTSPASVDALRRLVKKRERERFSAMWFLEPVQAYFSYGLIRLGLNSLQVTVLWLAIALVSYGFNCVGAAWAFVVGCVLVYIKIILDGCDGEVARYHKQFVSEQEDLESFINGIYLDKVFHIIEKPLWGMSLGYGVYRMTGVWWALPAGVSFGVFLGFTRHVGAVKEQLAAKFTARVTTVFPVAPVRSVDSLLVRTLDTLMLWIRNGKCFNTALVAASCVDWVLTAWGRTPVALLSLVLATGAACPVLVLHAVVRTVSSGELLRSAWAKSAGTGGGAAIVGKES